MALPNFSISNTSKSVIISYACPAGGLLTPIIVTATGENKILNLDLPDIAASFMTLDGIKVNYTKPAMITGTLTLNAASPAWNAFQQVANLSYQSDPIPGVLIVTAPLNIWVDTYQDFTLLTPFPGHSANERIDDIDIKFSAYLPNSLNLTAYAGLLTGL